MKLSEFKDKDALRVIADLLPYIGNIAQNEDAKAERGGSYLSFAAAMLKYCPEDTMAMLAILDNQNPDTYHCNAATVLRDVLNMIADKELLELFGLRSPTVASSGSASETTEAPEA